MELKLINAWRRWVLLPGLILLLWVLPLTGPYSHYFNSIAQAGFFNNDLETFEEIVDLVAEKYVYSPDHKKYPIYWGNQTAYPSMAFYITDDLGLEEEFTQELFDTNFKLNINIFQPKVIRFLAKEFKIEKEMKEGMQSPSIKSKTDRALALAKKYKANETPTLIINDVLKVTPSISKGNVDDMTANLEIIFKDILKIQ